MTREVEQRGKIPQLAGLVPGVGQFRAGVAELVEEWMDNGIDGAQTLCRRILQQPANQVDGVVISLAEDLAEGVRLDLGELVFHVVRIHGSDLFPSWCSQNLDDLHQLIDARLAREQRLPEHEFCHDTSSRPNI